MQVTAAFNIWLLRLFSSVVGEWVVSSSTRWLVVGNSPGRSIVVCVWVGGCVCRWVGVGGGSKDKYVAAVPYTQLYLGGETSPSTTNQEQSLVIAKCLVHFNIPGWEEQCMSSALDFDWQQGHEGP